jgi:excisionase family DNA binding protein
VTFGACTTKRAEHTIAADESKEAIMTIGRNSTNNPRKLKLESRTSVTVGGIANYCLVSESTVRRWIKDGKLSAIRLPSGQFRVTDNDFREFLARYDIPAKEL